MKSTWNVESEFLPVILKIFGKCNLVVVHSDIDVLYKSRNWKYQVLMTFCNNGSPLTHLVLEMLTHLKIWWLQFVVDIDIVVQAVAVVVTNNETGDNFDDAAADASEGMIVIISKAFLLCI